MENYNNEPKIKKILSYNNSKFFDFVRTPYNTTINEIDRIKHFDEHFVEGGNEGVVIFNENGRFASSRLITTNLSNVDLACNQIYGSGSWNREQWLAIWYVFVHESWRDDNAANLYITTNLEILQNRNWFTHHFPGLSNITTLDETMEIMDLFSKNQGEYLLENQFFANKGLWYWISFRSKIPHYNVPTSATSSLHSLSYRFTFLLQSIDEMGINYFSELNSDSGDTIQYHFNYFITLVSGILDSLAIETKDRYSITFTGDHIPSRLSLNSTAGRDFLLEIRNRDISLRTLITQFSNFINLIYQLRQTIIHRDFQRPVSYSALGSKTEANVIPIDSDINSILSQMNDRPQAFDSYSEWGVYQTPGRNFISPYEFSKKAALTLIEFVDEYLSRLGDRQFIDPSSRDRFVQEIISFKDRKLGF